VTSERVTADAASVRSQVLDEPQLHAWGVRFARNLKPGAVVALSGELGAGKTRLAQAVCDGLGVSEPVTSPTFAVVHSYHSPAGPVYHVDLYRLRNESEVAAIGLDEMIATAALTIVEWPERAPGSIPDDATRVSLEHVETDGGKRRVTVQS
jgi:tRNA threonylcarbamoyladenosine biosynthesis protein TsaE